MEEAFISLVRRQLAAREKANDYPSEEVEHELD
jgi:hypothetical protein